MENANGSLLAESRIPSFVRNRLRAGGLQPKGARFQAFPPFSMRFPVRC